MASYRSGAARHRGKHRWLKTARNAHRGAATASASARRRSAAISAISQRQRAAAAIMQWHGENQRRSRGMLTAAAHGGCISAIGIGGVSWRWRGIAAGSIKCFGIVCGKAAT